MVAKKRTTTRKKPVTKRAKSNTRKQAELHPNEAMLATAVGAVLILVSLALATSL